MITQNSQYVIKALTIFSSGAQPGVYAGQSTGKKDQFAIDIRGLFQELNVYDNLFFPCVSGTIVIQDAIGLNRKIRFDGSEYIYINITKENKTGGEYEPYEIKGTYLIHRVTDRTNAGMSSEVYTLHFISPEFLLSEQTKIRKAYTKKYSEIISDILRDYLNVTSSVSIKETKTSDKIIIPNLTPFKAIEFLAARALNNKDIPDFLFWQDHLTGYNFNSLSDIFSQDPQFEINFGTKNLSPNFESESNYVYTSFLGANDFKVISNFDLMKNIKNGYYAGKFFAFDTITRKFIEIDKKHEDIFNSTRMNFANRYPFNTTFYNKKRQLASEKFDSKITVFPFEIGRKDNSYIVSKEPDSLNFLDETSNYILERKSIFNNLGQRVIRITMPGNFRFVSGKTVLLNIPRYYNEKGGSAAEHGDKALSGKYIITAVRHMIRQDQHQTILEVSTDSSQLNPLTGET